MTTKRTFLIVGLITMTVLAVLATLHFIPRQYYRYHAGRVYLVEDPNVWWNGLGKAPTLQFTVPLFADARSWRPAPAQVRRELSRFHANLTEQEITVIIRACVPCGTSTK